MEAEMDEATICQCLKQYFKFDKFRSDLQKEAVLEVCQRRHDVLISMPTGSGKSLCYQLPAMMYQDKVTLIFSPLLALVKDQIDHLLKLKIRAASINSKVTRSERQSVIADLKSTSPNIRILYVTPEQAATSTFKDLYENLHRFNKVAYLVVDEAHCVSEWGHDFRPYYRRLAELRENVDVPCIALTATANSEVTKDIINNLKLGQVYGRDLRIYKSSCFRRNLFYDVFFPNILEDPYKHLKDFVSDCLKDEEGVSTDKKACGIIYCRTREQTEVLMERLNKLGVKTLCYHAGLKSHERTIFQDKWQSGDVPVMCATISFGMGVDKATVRFIVHWGSPKDPASYYQETGRAGRDGRPAKCRVYYNRADSKATEYHLSHDLGRAGSRENRRKRAEQAIKDFRKIVEYCENPTECRHRLFSNHFGEPPPKCVNRCDFCKDKRKVQDMAELFLTKSIQYRTKAQSYSDTDYSELYGRGRQGAVEEQGSGSSDDGAAAALEREKVKKATGDFMKAQFALRKNQHEMSRETMDRVFSKHARVKAAASTSTKFRGLTLATREQYVSKLLDVLYENYRECQEDPELDRKDVEDCAVDIEYDMFSMNKSIIMYKNSIAKFISEVKKCTGDELVHEKLLLFQPKFARNETLSDLFRNITKEQQLRKLENGDHKKDFRSAKDFVNERKENGMRGQSKIMDFFRKEDKEDISEGEIKDSDSDGHNDCDTEAIKEKAPFSIKYSERGNSRERSTSWKGKRSGSRDRKRRRNSSERNRSRERQRKMKKSRSRSKEIYRVRYRSKNRYRDRSKDKDRPRRSRERDRSRRLSGSVERHKMFRNRSRNRDSSWQRSRSREKSRGRRNRDKDRKIKDRSSERSRSRDKRSRSPPSRIRNRSMSRDRRKRSASPMRKKRDSSTEGSRSKEERRGKAKGKQSRDKEVTSQSESEDEERPKSKSKKKKKKKKRESSDESTTPKRSKKRKIKKKSKKKRKKVSSESEDSKSESSDSTSESSSDEDVIEIKREEKSPDVVQEEVGKTVVLDNEILNEAADTSNLDVESVGVSDKSPDFTDEVSNNVTETIPECLPVESPKPADQSIDINEEVNMSLDTDNEDNKADTSINICDNEESKADTSINIYDFDCEASVDNEVSNEKTETASPGPNDDDKQPQPPDVEAQLEEMHQDVPKIDEPSVSKETIEVLPAKISFKPALKIDPVVERYKNETMMFSNGETKKRLRKAEIGLLVVNLLTPAYVDRRFESRAVFKAMARNITHTLANKNEEEIKINVKWFLKRNTRITAATQFVKCKLHSGNSDRDF